MASHPGLIFFLQMVSHPGQILIVDGWCPILVKSLLLMDGVPSWSQHQKLQEDGMVQVLFTISLLVDTPQLGAARDPGHGTKNCKRMGWYRYYS